MHRNGNAGGVAGLRPAVLGMGRLMSMGYATVAAAPLAADGHGDREESEGGTAIWILAVASLALTLIGGVFAGLTIA